MKTYFHYTRKYCTITFKQIVVRILAVSAYLVNHRFKTQTFNVELHDVLYDVGPIYEGKKIL
jgi:hypothetical protein